MKIDITPKLELASRNDKICLEMRKIDALYVIRLANGKDYSVKFEREELGLFQPKRTVSEMIKIWEESIIRRYEIAREALSTGLHPTDTFERKVMALSPTGYEYFTGRTEIVRSSLDSYEKNHFKREMINREKEFGSMVFIKIC